MSDQEQTLDQAVDFEIRQYVITIPDDELNVALTQLELRVDGTQFIRYDRLHRRLRGDYSAEDFVVSVERDAAAQHRRREEKLATFIHRSTLSQQAKAEITIRMQGYTAGLYDYTALPSTFSPLANSSTSLHSAGMSFTQCIESAGRQAQQINTIQNSQNNAIQNSPNVEENRVQNCTAPTSQQNLIPATSANAPVSDPTVNNPSSTATLVSVHQPANTATSTTVSDTGIYNTMRQSFEPRTVFSSASSRDDRQLNLLPYKFSDGVTRFLPYEAAMEIARTQSISIALQQKNKELQLQLATLASSTRLAAAPQEGDLIDFGNIGTPSHISAIPRQTKSQVNFQDTYDLRYVDRLRPTINTHNVPTNTNKPTRTAQASCTTQEQQPPLVDIEQLTGQQQSVALNVQPSQHTSEFSHSKYDVGRTVRTWKINFSGDKTSSIEEFLQRVDECRKLAHINDEDLLNSMTELMSGVALHWCRQSRKNWHNWDDFCKAARRFYGVDRRFQQKLIVEAQNRSQGEDEPVRDYIICLLTILSKFETEWDESKQIDLIYNNMLPKLQSMIRRENIDTIDSLIEHARYAEELWTAERNYVPPPPPEKSLLPECAYKARKAPNVNKTVIAAVSDNNQEIIKIINNAINEKLKTKNLQPGLAAMTPNPPEELSKTIEKLLKEKISKLLPSVEQKAPQQQSESSPKNEEEGGEKQNKKGSRKPKQKPATPKSDKNKNQPPGPFAEHNLFCWSCSWPGHITKTCPECSGNAKRDG